MISLYRLKKPGDIDASLMSSQNVNRCFLQPL